MTPSEPDPDRTGVGKAMQQSARSRTHSPRPPQSQPRGGGRYVMSGSKWEWWTVLTVVIAVVVCIPTSMVAAELPVVTGVVRDAMGKPLAGVTVSAGTAKAVSGEDGAYRLYLR